MKTLLALTAIVLLAIVVAPTIATSANVAMIGHNQALVSQPAWDSGWMVWDGGWMVWDGGWMVWDGGWMVWDGGWMVWDG